MCQDGKKQCVEGFGERVQHRSAIYSRFESQCPQKGKMEIRTTEEIRTLFRLTDKDFDIDGPTR